LLHALALFHGIAAATLCLAWLYVAGAAILPTRWARRSGSAAGPIVIGAATYVLACWFGLQAGVRVTTLAAAHLAATGILAVIRFRALARSFRDAWKTRTAATACALLAGLYTLGYLFVLPPPSADSLPLAWLGNVDLFTYLVYSQHLLHLGPSPVADVSTHSYVYFQTPGVFYLLDALSLPFGADPMRAAMPAIFTGAALAGAAAASICRRAFGLGVAGSALVAAAMLSGPFFRFVEGHYYLSTLFALPVLLHLYRVTVVRDARPQNLAGLSLVFLAHYVLLLLLYPYLLAIGAGLQAVAAALMVFSSWRDRETLRPAIREAARTAGAMAAAALILVAIVPTHVLFVVRMLRLLSQTGLWGWPLDLLSPLAILGAPGVMGRSAAGSAGVRLAFQAGTWVIGGLGILLAVSLSARRGATREQRAFLGMAGTAFLAYGGYFVLAGPSYQQWKLASYTALPLAFAFVAQIYRFLERLQPGPAAGGARRTALAYAAPALAVVLIAGNLVVHAVSDPPFRRLPGHRRNIASLNSLPFRDLSVEVPDYSVAMTVSYFLPNKRLHVSMRQFIPDEPFRLEDVSPARPLLLLDYACEGVGHQDVRDLGATGCLTFQPPSLLAGESYPFGRTYLFVEFSGLDRREDWGRWNRRAGVGLTLMADPRRVQLESDAAWLNLRLESSPAADGSSQLVRVNLGGEHAEVTLGEPGWISLPLRASLWQGEWLARLALSIELPGAAPSRVGFLELSVGPQPRGRRPDRVY
jgi:hypothetical protein